MSNSQDASEPTKRKRRWFRFSLRTLLIVVVILGIGFAWVAFKFQQVWEQRKVVAEIEKVGGESYFCYELRAGTSPGPAWLKEILGEDFFATVVHVYLYDKKATDDTLANIAKLTELETLIISNIAVSDVGIQHVSNLTKLVYLELSHTCVSNAGLAHLKKLKQLKTLDLSGSRVTGEGFVHLRHLSNLEELYILSEQATRKNILALKQALPQVRIADRSGISNIRASPSGDHIAFSVNRGSRYRLWVLSVIDGTIKKTEANAFDFRWHPDGSSIVCCSMNPGSDNGRLDLLDLQNDRIAPFVKPTCSQPRFSPDGRYLGYFDWDLNSLVIRDLDTREKVAERRVGNYADGWCWATDSTKVFYSQKNGSIYEYSLDDETKRVLLAAAPTMPSESPA
ncbi:MAG: PD40 domain-containing protein, partial [Planctomycetes bacterium]|nr:PD40 domain-containing protein [Planctomycetota bacterium]